MSAEPKQRPPGPPHNPWLREVIAGKRRWAAPLTREATRAGFPGWHERGYLPHRDEPGLTQFVTYRVADSFPATLRSEWEALLKIEDDRERRKKLEAYPDLGRGACWLRTPVVAELVQSAFRFHDGTDYELRAWAVMPNHVHVLVMTGAKPLRQVIADWKQFTAREANKLLGRRGKFWAEDYWDTYMRDAAHELRARRYIENNPVKALLVREPAEWVWSSARFRDKYGRLCS
jgi:putative transposase